MLVVIQEQDFYLVYYPECSTSFQQATVFHSHATLNSELILSTETMNQYFN